MKKAVFCLLGLLGFVGTPAVAADMPVPWTAPPAAEARWNWTGFYVGGGLGGDWSRFETKLTTVNGPVPLFAPGDVGRINTLGSPTIWTLNRGIRRQARLQLPGELLGFWLGRQCLVYWFP